MVYYTYSGRIFLMRTKLIKNKKTYSLRPDAIEKLEFWATKRNKTQSELIEDLIGGL